MGQCGGENCLGHFLACKASPCTHPWPSGALYGDRILAKMPVKWPKTIEYLPRTAQKTNIHRRYTSKPNIFINWQDKPNFTYLDTYLDQFTFMYTQVHFAFEPGALTSELPSKRGMGIEHHDLRVSRGLEFTRTRTKENIAMYKANVCTLLIYVTRNVLNDTFWKQI